jgi:electron transport complex protein RnfG
MNLLTRDKETVLYQGGLLGLSAGLATLFLLLLYSFTADTIELRLREDQLAGLDQVISPSRYQNDLLETQRQWLLSGQEYQVFTAKDNSGNISGYALQMQAKGFAGPIILLIGLDEERVILGVRVLAHSETPGLGDKIEIARNNWIRSFEGHSLDNTPDMAWAVKKDGGEFDQFTGATITPRAVVKGIHQSLQVMDSEIVQVTTEGKTNE